MKAPRERRTDQQSGAAFKGSQLWLQRFVAERPDLLQPSSLPPLNWVSPKASHKFREYGDGAFLDILGLEKLRPELAAFWPSGGPHWDGLATFDGGVLLVEAKAHVREFLSPGTKASADPRKLIADSLNVVRQDLGARQISDWTEVVYQYTNRLAHLWWLRRQDVKAYLLLVGFTHDAAVGGPSCAEVWQAAYLVADHALGLPRGHSLSNYILHAFPDVRQLG